MVCPPVREDNLRALARELSPCTGGQSLVRELSSRTGGQSWHNYFIPPTSV